MNEHMAGAIPSGEQRMDLSERRKEFTKRHFGEVAGLIPSAQDLAPVMPALIAISKRSEGGPDSLVQEPAIGSLDKAHEAMLAALGKMVSYGPKIGGYHPDGYDEGL